MNDSLEVKRKTSKAYGYETGRGNKNKNIHLKRKRYSKLQTRHKWVPGAPRIAFTVLVLEIRFKHRPS